MATTPLAPNDKLLRLREAATRLGIATFTMRDWALQGKVMYRRLGVVLATSGTARLYRRVIRFL